MAAGEARGATTTAAAAGDAAASTQAIDSPTIRARFMTCPPRRIRRALPVSPASPALLGHDAGDDPADGRVPDEPVLLAGPDALHDTAEAAALARGHPDDEGDGVALSMPPHAGTIRRPSPKTVRASVRNSSERCYSPTRPAEQVMARASAGLSVRLLGGLSVSLRSGEAVSLPTRKARALLAYLAVRPGEAHPRAKLATLLWGDAPDEQAHHRLRQTLFDLRKALPVTRPRCLVADARGLALNASAVDVDVATFERLVTRATPVALAQAADLYRGDFLEGLGVREPGFEDWLVVERERLRELALHALGKLLAHHAETGPDERAIQTALRLLALDPLREDAHRALMRLFARQGRRGAALRQYQVCVSVLGRELGVEPEAETKRLYQAMLRATPARVAEPAPSSQPARGRPRGPRPRLPAPEPPLVGREAEARRLQEARDGAWAGRGQVVLVLGEAGIGKTSLVEALAADTERRGGRILAGHAHESEQILPFRPWVSALRAGQVVSEAELLDGLQPVWRQELARLFPELGEERLQLSTRPEDCGRLFEAVAELVEQVAARHRLAIVLEDLHWADELSVRLLAFLARRVQSRPVLLLGTARDEELASAPLLGRLLQELDRERRLSRVDLAPLSRAGTLSLVRALARAGSDEGRLARLGEQVWALSAGNPFVIVETMRALQDGRVPDTPEGLPLPQRVREVIDARLERLSPSGRHLLSVAAVVGQDCSFALLQRAGALGERETAEGVEELVRRRVLHAVEERFAVTHDRIREVAYARLLAPTRRALHEAVAGALEALAAPQVRAVADRLAYHYARAERADKAVTYLIQASEESARRYALDDALRTLRDAQVLVERLPAESRDRRHLDVGLRLADCLYLLGRFQEVVHLLLGQRERLDRVQEPRLAGPYHFWLGHAHGLLGDQERAVESLQRALDEADRCGDEATVGKAHYALARECFWSGRLRQGIEHGHQAVARLEKTAERTWLGLAFWALGINYAFSGDLGEALAAERAAHAIARAIADSRLESFAGWSAGLIHALAGDGEAAIEACRESLEASPAPTSTALGLSHLGYAYLEQGDAARALAVLQQAVEQLDRLRMPKSRGRVEAWLGAAYLLAGDVEKAREAATRGWETTREGGHRYGTGEASRVLGQIAQARGALAEAERHLSAALDTFSAIDARLEVGRTRLALAQLAHRQGRSDAVAAHLADAGRLFGALRLPRYVERAEQLARMLG
jgi:DNA-binding SARP family transcriptional activator